MRRVNWTITEGQHRALKRLSQRTGLSISELVRRALDSYLAGLNENATVPAPKPAKDLHHERSSG